MKRFPVSTILGLAFGILLAFGAAVSAFQSPTQAPPGGNVPAPLNVGPSNQTKTGGLLQVFNLWVNGALGVTGGATFGGNVLIGPGGTGKLTVGTIDPIYEIDGKKYATYVADTAGGVTIETSGVVNVQGGSYEIDFNTQEQGSNLWLFWQSSNKNIKDIVVLVTPSFDGKAWYEKIQKKNKIIIRSATDGQVSFRFTAPRQDAGQWPNEIKE